MDWIWWVIGAVVFQQVIALIFWRDREGGFQIGSDPEGGTFGKMFNWHKRKRQHTTIGSRPDPINKEDGYTDNGDGSYSRPIK